MFKTSLISLFVAVAAAGCGDDTGHSTDMAVVVLTPHNFDEINTQILSESCAKFTVCHSVAGEKDAGHLNLATDPYNALVGVAANNAKAAGQGLVRVKPCDSKNSFLHIKLTLPANTDPKTDYGAWMPDSNPKLPDATIKAIADWIDRGALRNEPATVTGSTCALGKDMATTD